MCIPLIVSQVPLIAEAASNPALGGIGPLITGIVIVAVLIGVIPWAIHRRRTQPRPPRPSEQPRRPDRRARIKENREPDTEAFPDDGSRLTPHQLKSHSTHPGSVDHPESEDREGGSLRDDGPGC
ncbi:DUF6479 family protein [Streptomyces sp. NPDC059828]|uniref:DUF6479 family protein n=1 Tax=Streptomyces sp. NPDC059828 TaxID=3346965 RepID=UPI00364A68F9